MKEFQFHQEDTYLLILQLPKKMKKYMKRFTGTTFELRKFR